MENIILEELLRLNNCYGKLKEEISVMKKEIERLNDIILKMEESKSKKKLGDLLKDMKDDLERMALKNYN